VVIPHSFTGATEEYDGTSWTSPGSMNTARQHLAGFGTQTAALALVVQVQLQQEQQKNIMVHLGQILIL
jgi:hypothetical protein